MSIAEKEVFPKKALSRSLALRILIVSMLLLALPLFLHTLWMYWQEYKESKKELLVTLYEEGESRLFLIDQMVDSQINFLKVVKENMPQNSDAGLNQFFHVWAEMFQASTVFYLEKEGGKLQCLASSVDRMVGEDFSFLQDQLKKENFVFLSYSPHSKEKLLYVAHTLYDGGKDPIGALVIGNPADYLLRRLEEIGEVHYPIHLALIDKEGAVFAGSDPAFLGKTIEKAEKKEDKKFIMYPLKDSLHGYELIGEEKYFAVLLPIKNSTYSLLITASEKRITASQMEGFARHIYTFLFFFIILGGILTFLVALRFGRPMRELYKVIDRIASGDVSARYQKDRLGFEINLLGEHFNEMMRALLHQQKSFEVEKLQKEILAEELKIGHQIQQAMFPAEIPEVAGLEIAASYAPAKEVGGDFYDLFMREKELAIAIADTSGKGISSCLYSLGMRSMIRSFGSLLFPLKKILVHANNLFYRDIGEQGMFVTAWMALFDPHTRKLTYSSAGHYPALLRKKEGKILPLTTKGIALGVTLIEDVETEETVLQEGDILILYTDGVIEAMDLQARAYGMKRLEEFLSKQEEKSSAAIAKDLLEEIQNFSQGTEQHDDVTFLVIRIAPAK